ncbi:MAG: mannosyltransferase B-like protein [Candidatus Daviesbacteria bacterium GW2011_GWA2_38_24]|uniref:Mannosyltransferase B-like protein n=1 Tax=Candidatus Daviesbacteria bacterium GW2011_GWA2_38_24 TaxID=1618422 RepID=A0A0G0JK30_9BACT|nr:MAG: mannosyltransferase B-like protein [Candidatus Daviesbacteria bacterium GW2011_GWA2_38_24]OGE23304.1 MAG: hypothetical protein A2688_04330 [Candidatus Daviesbacteria bacterium RIFCSPHIGHO2_01_FULL_38_8]
MAKKIWIDGYEANVLQRLGSGQVAFELLKNIEKLDRKNEYTILLSSIPLEDLPREREGWKYKILKPNKLWTRIALPLALYTTKNKPDLMFSPTHYGPRFSPVKKIVTIFDLAYLHFPQMFKKKDLFQLTNWTKQSIESAKHIITISNFSKNDILKTYNKTTKEVTVAYPGYNSGVFCPINDSKKISEIKKKYKIDGNYLIYIGTVQPRKNLIRLIEAFKDIEDFKLVVVGKTKGLGKEGWMFEETLNKPKELGIEEKVIFTGFIPNEELSYLINGATAFVLPSLYEGFGIPAVDAMACGKPVLVSNVSSLPEVVEGAGLLFDPKSVDDIKEKIELLIEDPKLQKELSEKSLEQAKKFSWEKMAQEVIQVFEKI